MKIWVDADASPAPVKEILYKAAERLKIHLTLVANQSLRVPPSQFIKTIQVAKGFDVADSEIVQRLEPGDLVITADIPLAAEVIEKGAEVISPRGEKLTSNNIKARLNMRDFLETMRSSGIESGGPPAYSQTDRKAFADQLDKYLVHAKKTRCPDPESPGE